MGAHGSARALAQVDLQAVEANARHLVSLLDPGVQMCAVVKADGYGHGAIECAHAALAGGASWLATASADEAVELRAAGIEAPLLVMGALTAVEADAALACGSDVVAWEPEFVRALADRVEPEGAPARVHLKLDTGMGRLGSLDPAQLVEVARIVRDDPRLEPVGLMTHFATADEPGDEHFPTQLRMFADFAAELRREHPRLIVHAANSAAVYRDRASHFDMVRCGIALYGMDPFQEDPAERGLRPALALRSTVGAVRCFEAGRSAGYGRRWKAGASTWVATIPIGYGDGWRRALTNDCDVLIEGRRHALVGTVSMDNITVELGPETSVRPGAAAVLIGAQGEERILAEEVARRLGTINYEVTCGLTARVRRAYDGDF